MGVEPLRVHSITDPRKLALIVIDMQNLFLAAAPGADGSYAAGVAPTVNRLIDAVRCRGGTVVFTCHTAALDDNTHNTTLADLRLMGFFDLRTTDGVVAELAVGQFGPEST